MNKKDRKVIDKINRDMKKACRQYLFEPITSELIEAIKRTMAEIIERRSGEWFDDFDKYVNVTIDPNKSNVFIISIKRNAPLWVYEVLHEMRKKSNGI